MSEVNLGSIELLLVVIVCLLIYLAGKVGRIARRQEGEKDMATVEAPKEKDAVSPMLTPDLLGKRCVVEQKLDAVSLFDGFQTCKAILVDYDAEWILLETASGKRTRQRAVRIAQIKSISKLES